MVKFMAKRRALKDTVKDPMAKKEIRVNPGKKQNPAAPKGALKIVVSLIIGFAGGLLTGRFIKL
jgi:hypothetical protein